MATLAARRHRARPRGRRVGPGLRGTSARQVVVLGLWSDDASRSDAVSGKPGRSGLPGNQNGLVHWARSRMLAVPRGREWIGAMVRPHHRVLLVELGGADVTTEAQPELLRAAMICQLNHLRSPGAGLR